jgi:hypothetical protein
MIFAFQLGLVLLVIWGLWTACRPRPLFVVRIEQGRPRVSRGKVTQAFLEEVRLACERHQVKGGTVTGVAQAQRIALGFSGGVPEPCRQQLRNIWNLSRWSAAPRRRRGR